MSQGNPAPHHEEQSSPKAGMWFPGVGNQRGEYYEFRFGFPPDAQLTTKLRVQLDRVKQAFATKAFGVLQPDDWHLVRVLEIAERYHGVLELQLRPDGGVDHVFRVPLRTQPQEVLERWATECQRAFDQGEHGTRPSAR